MTANKQFKRKVREFAKRSGRSYAAARALLEKKSPQGLRAPIEDMDSGTDGRECDHGRNGDAGVGEPS